jgi:hypothetical protein
MTTALVNEIPSTAKPGSDPRQPSDLKDLIWDAISEVAPELVHQSVAKEEERRFRQLKWVVLFIGLIGLGTFGTLATFVIEKAVDAKAGGIKETLELTRINGLALKLDNGKSFATNERDEAMALLMRISKHPTLKTAPDVRTTLSSILKSFTAAGLSAEIDQLYGAFGPEILVDGLSTEILLHHYGQSLVARSTKPTLGDGPLSHFEQLEQVAGGHELGELALAYRVLFESRDGAKDERVRDLVRVSLDLGHRDASRFLREILLRTRATNWQRGDHPSGPAFERVTRQFLQDRQGVLAAAYRMPAEAFKAAAHKGVDDDTAEALADQAVTAALRDTVTASSQ